MKKTNEQWPMRLQLFMAKAGVASRRRCERIIEEGRVAVNGRLIVRQGETVGPEDVVTLDGTRLRISANPIYLAMNKPPRYLCSNHDPEGRPLVLDLLRDTVSERLFTVGRLDFMSTGLILLTNDGEFARAVSHPSSRIEKEYLVETRKPVAEELLERYRRGIQIDGETYRLKDYRVKNARRVHLVLEEGKNREIRRVFAHFNVALKRVHRVRIGTLWLSNLSPGMFRPLNDREIKKLLALAADRSGEPSESGGRRAHGKQDSE